MLTNEDIQNLIKAQEEIFATKEDLERLKEDVRSDFSELQSSVDAYAKKADTFFEEMVSLSHKVDRHEKWFHIIADKLGVKLEY